MGPSTQHREQDLECSYRYTLQLWRLKLQTFCKNRETIKRIFNAVFLAGDIAKKLQVVLSLWPSSLKDISRIAQIMPLLLLVWQRLKIVGLEALQLFVPLLCRC